MFGRRHHSQSTAVGHFLTFVKAMLEEMDEYPEEKGHYLIVDKCSHPQLSKTSGSAYFPVDADTFALPLLF